MTIQSALITTVLQYTDMTQSGFQVRTGGSQRTSRTWSEITSGRSSEVWGGRLWPPCASEVWSESLKRYFWFFIKLEAPFQSLWLAFWGMGKSLKNLAGAFWEELPVFLSRPLYWFNYLQILVSKGSSGTDPPWIPKAHSEVQRWNHIYYIWFCFEKVKTSSKAWGISIKEQMNLAYYLSASKDLWCSKHMRVNESFINPKKSLVTTCSDPSSLASILRSYVRHGCWFCIPVRNIQNGPAKLPFLET